ncbi:hypothetical protein B2J93_2647 [Marssonina coronariae]|uniref:Uncharacterized protein n=1 Tax=Diplocarpon coronariae TaxID=2795749 RepID=A0A218Z7R2_9HELO|nr:hypothetical protein B2J93_2647 [Marssonina coronariae]
MLTGSLSNAGMTKAGTRAVSRAPEQDDTLISPARQATPERNGIRVAAASRMACVEVESARREALGDLDNTARDLHRGVREARPTSCMPTRKIQKTDYLPPSEPERASQKQPAAVSRDPPTRARVSASASAPRLLGPLAKPSVPGRHERGALASRLAWHRAAGAGSSSVEASG